MKEHYFKYQESYSYLRHSPLMAGRKTLLFLHGIGDSSLSYLPFLHSPVLSQFNILIPDLLGHGKSSVNSDYHFKNQVEAIIQQINAIEVIHQVTFDNIILIAHSMGSIHAMELCHSRLKQKIKGVISIEGSITQYGSFISEETVKMAAQGHFESWFQDFKEVTIFEHYTKKFPVCRSYYSSLTFCDPNAFLQNALEIQDVFHRDQTKRYTNSAGWQFVKLAIPKLYCYGDQSLCQESIDFLTENQVPTQVYHSQNHFFMLDYLDEFALMIKKWS